MSIKPIDLQTLYSHINQVGREQAVQKDAILTQQALAGQEIVEETQERDESVNETDSTSDGPNAINEEKEQAGSEENRKRKNRDDDKKEPAKKQYYSDPELGSHIDIEG